MSGLKVLLIDASPVFLRAAKAFLESTDEVDEVYTARTAATGHRTLASSRIDLVIADCSLLGSGLQHGVARIRAAAGATKLVLLSLEDSAAAHVASQAAGADAFCGKAEFGERLPAILSGMAPRRQDREARG